MSFTYSGNPSNSALDFIRFKIGDTVDVGHCLEDAEIEYIIDTYNITTIQLAAAFRQMATCFSKVPKRSLGPQSEDGTKRAQYYISQAEYYEKLAIYSSGVPPLPEYQAEKAFEKNMFSNE